MQRISDSDFELLFISRDVMIGNTKITVKPLGLAGLASVMPAIMRVFGEFNDRKEKAKGKSEGDILAEMAVFISEHAQDVLSVACNIHPDGISRLPGGKVLELAIAALDVNLKAQAGLEKNLLELPRILEMIPGKKTAPAA